VQEARAAWDAAIGAIDAARTKEMAAPGLQEPAKKALATLDRERDGLIAHRDYPMTGLDNNTAERAIRGPVVARKNAGGSSSAARREIAFPRKRLVKACTSRFRGNRVAAAERPIAGRNGTAGPGAG
jgi:hypothetical protein